MLVVEKNKNQMLSLPATEINPRDAKNISSELAIRILKLLSRKHMYPIEIAKELKVHEQKVYYHIRNFEKAGIIRKTKEETKQGATAKYYSIENPALVIKFKELENSSRIQLKGDSEFLEPFINEGQLNARIIVGSPDPHGPEKARSRDGYYGMDLALFIGTFLNYVPNFYVKLDTEAREQDLKNNLIVIGGPVVNKVTAIINQKMPIKFARELHWAIKSSVTDNVYPSDETGLIVKMKNPFNAEKSILVVAGKRHTGTRAAIIAFLKYFNDITKGNAHNKKISAKVVEGVDLDSDGIIDDVEIRE